MTTTTAPPAGTATAPDPRRWWALGALMTSMLVLSFDLTILNVALPTMAAEIHAGTGAMQWIVDSYTVVFAAGCSWPAWSSSSPARCSAPSRTAPDRWSRPAR
jgi:MFS family permease